MGAAFSLEGVFAYISETFAAAVIKSYQGEVPLEETPLVER